LAHHESDIRAAAPEPLSLDQLLAMLGDAAEQGGRSREDAIACFLSASEGWREAMKRLGGTFAEGTAGLSDPKQD
jgi:hypothetical protein